MSTNDGGRGVRRSKRRGEEDGEGGGRDSGDPVIAEVMSENDIDPQDIPRAKVCGHFEPDNLDSIHGSERYFLVRGFAWYRQHEPPTGCTRKWASAHSWCVIDLKQQRIIHKYGQDCKTCGGKSTPSFNEEARRRMAEYVCKKYLYRTGRLQRTQPSQPDMTDLSGEREGPHDQSRCDMCKVLGHSCRSRASEAEVRSDRHSDYQSLFYHYSRSAASSQSSSPVSYTPDTQIWPAVHGTSCSSSDHSQETDDFSSAFDMTYHYTTRQPRQTPRSHKTQRRSHPPTIPQSHTPDTRLRGRSTMSSAGRVQTDPMLGPMLHCTICGSTDHSYWSCTTRREQERVSSTNGEQVATVGGRSSTRQRGSREQSIGLLGLAAVGAVAVGLGALLLGRR